MTIASEGIICVYCGPYIFSSYWFFIAIRVRTSGSSPRQGNARISLVYTGRAVPQCSVKALKYLRPLRLIVTGNMLSILWNAAEGAKKHATDYYFAGVHTVKSGFCGVVFSVYDEADSYLCFGLVSL